MGILLGLATALFWGGSDFVARFASRRIGSLRAAFFMQACGFLFLTIFLSATGFWGHLFDDSGWRPWAWGIFAGVINTFAMLALYRSFEIGKLSVVAPISASYPVLTVILSAIAGETLTVVRGFGIAATILGVILVARGEPPSAVTADTSSRPRNSGLLCAFGAACGFGFLFWLLGVRIMPMTGALATVWLIRVTGAILMLAILLIRRLPVFQADRVASLQGAGMGSLDTGAFVLSNLGMQMEQLSVVSVLGSLYGAVTVVLAAIFLRERIGRTQWLGIISVFAGIFLISL